MADLLRQLVLDPAPQEDVQLVRQTLAALTLDQVALFPPPAGQEEDEDEGDVLSLLADWRARPVAVLAVVHARVQLALDSLLGTPPSSDPTVSSSAPAPAVDIGLDGHAAAHSAFHLVAHLAALQLPAYIASPSESAPTVNVLGLAFARLAKEVGWERQAVGPLGAMLDAWASTAPHSLASLPPAPAGGSALSATTTASSGHRSRHVLTGLHAPLLEACLRTGELGFARERLLVKGPIDGVFAKHFALSPLDFPTTSYLLAHLSLLLHPSPSASALSTAADHLLSALSTPTASGSAAAVQLGAHKKLVLVQLLIGRLEPGDVGGLPKYTSAGVGKTITGSGGGGGTYRKLVEVVGSLSRSASAITLGASLGPTVADVLSAADVDTLKKDANLGLAEAVLRTVLERRIARLCGVYKRIAVGELAGLVGVCKGEVGLLEERLVKMVQDGKLSLSLATLPDPVSAAPTTVITFISPSPSPADGRALLERLERLNKRGEEVQCWAWSEDRRLGMEGKWVAKLVKDAAQTSTSQPSGPPTAAPGGGGMAGLSMEEDLMEGLGGPAAGGAAVAGGGGGVKRNTYEDDY